MPVALGGRFRFMRFTSAITTEAQPAKACRELLEHVSGVLAPEDVDLLMIYGAGYEADEFGLAAQSLAEGFPAATSMGCSAWGTIGEAVEHYDGTSMSVLAGSIPGASAHPLQFESTELDDQGDWIRNLPVTPESEPTFIVLADPFTFPVNGFLDGINDKFPGAAVIGGLASGGQDAGQNRLLLDGVVYQGGLVGVALTGDILVDTVVSQGCRPIGQHHVVTKGEANVIYELGGRQVTAVLQDVISNINDKDLDLIRNGGLFLGTAIDAYRRQFSRGDFLIQNVMGSDPTTGAIAIAGPVRRGATVQFHVRDAASADEDLRAMLAPHAVASGGSVPAAGVIFSCNGRGKAMWSEPGHDVGVLQDSCGALPVAGFFCAGELGPVGGTNFVHGFTASIGLLRGKVS